MSTNSKDYCSKCQLVTNHKCLYKFTENSDYNSDFHWEQNYETIQCLGCETIQFRNRFTHEEMYDYDEEGVEFGFYESKYYPKSLNNHSLIKNVYHLPDKIRIVYNETIEALKNNCYLLSGVGLRAIIEAICIDQKITGRNLETKINNLVKNKLITEKDCKRLHSIRFIGNDSVHEMEVPNENKLRIALDIAEHLLKNLYLIDIDVNEHLETIITEYDDFKNKIIWKIKLPTINIGTELTIKDILNKDFRRIESNYLQNFTSKLINDINTKVITTISIGKIENGIQYFVKN